MTNIIDKNTLGHAFLRAMQKDFMGYEEALNLAAPVKTMLENYSNQTKEAARDLLCDDYKSFQADKREITRFSGTRPFLSFDHLERVNPRRWSQEIYFDKLRVNNRWSDLSNIVTGSNGNPGNKKSLRVEYSFKDQTVSLYEVKTMKREETRHQIFVRPFPADGHQSRKLVTLLTDEILDWAAEYAPATFLEEIVPHIAKTQELSRFTSRDPHPD